MNLKQARLIREIREHEAAGARPAVVYLEEIMGHQVEDLHVSIRRELVEKLNELVEDMSRNPLVAPAGKLTRDEVASLAMAHGIDVLTSMHTEY